MLQEVNAGIVETNAPTLTEHLATSRKQGKVEPAYVEKGTHVTILVGLDGNSASPGEELAGAIFIDGLLTTSTPGVKGVIAKNRLQTIFVTAVTEGEHAALGIEEQETGVRPVRRITFEANEEIPKGDQLVTITSAHQMASEFMFKKEKGTLRTREIIAAGPKLLKLQAKAARLRKNALKKASKDSD